MDKPDRKQSHFDDEIFINKYGFYYYRGTPFESKNQIEKSLKLKEGVSQKEVLRAKRDLLESLSNIGQKYGRTKLSKIFNEYLESRKNEFKNNPEFFSRKSMQETQGIVVNHFVPWFHSIQIEQIDQGAFDGYAEFKFKKGLALKNHRKVMNHFLKWCTRKKYIKHRPEIELPKQFTKPKRQRIILDDAEVTAFFEKPISDKLLLYVSMYLFMGMRNSEICKLLWEEIDFANSALKINPLSNRRRKARVVPINHFVSEMLLKRRATAVGPYVFANQDDHSRHMHVGSIRKAWTTFIKSAGLNMALTPHDLRATFETHMHRNTKFTDTQREKMAGASIDVQKNIYITMDADALRGLENSVQIKEVNRLIKIKLGKSLGNSPKTKKAKG